MASFISGLSLLILVLINGCFTLPISEIQFPDFTASPFFDDLTTENNFNLRAVADNEEFTTPFTVIKGSENEGIFWQTETNPTDIKRSLSESESFDVTSATVEFELSTDISRQERISEEPFTFTETTEQSFEQKRTVEEPITFTDMLTTETSFPQERAIEEPWTSTDSETTERLTTVAQELEVHSEKRGFQDEDVTTKSFEKSNIEEIRSPFTTASLPLFTSTSSAAAPELYKFHTAEFSSIETSTRKYVGSLVDPADDIEEHKTHDEHDMEDSRKHSKKPEKENKSADEEHREEEHYRHENIVDTDEKTDRKNKRPTSVDRVDGETYLVGELYDHDSSKFRATLPSNVAILDESFVAVTAELLRSSTTSKTSNEDTKLTQGEESS